MNLKFYDRIRKNFSLNDGFNSLLITFQCQAVKRGNTAMNQEIETYDKRKTQYIVKICFQKKHLRIFRQHRLDFKFLSFIVIFFCVK